MTGEAAGAFFAAIANGALDETFRTDLLRAVDAFESRLAAGMCD
jgi:hypothetical protein